MNIQGGYIWSRNILRGWHDVIMILYNIIIYICIYIISTVFVFDRIRKSYYLFTCFSGYSDSRANGTLTKHGLLSQSFMFSKGIQELDPWHTVDGCEILHQSVDTRNPIDSRHFFQCFIAIPIVTNWWMACPRMIWIGSWDFRSSGFMPCAARG